MFNFKLTGIGSINKDYKHFNTEVYNAMQVGLITVGSELTKQLQQHIQKDVYDAYTPKSYPRRSIFPQYGTPLDSKNNMGLSIGKMSLTFSYEPDGSHSGVNRNRIDWNDLPDKYRKEPDKPIKPNPVHGDKLIKRIETGKGYDWDCDIPPRPFWNNFMEEMIGTNGQAENLFVKGMNEAQPDLQVKKDGKIERDENDTIFPQQPSYRNASSEGSLINWYDEDDSPF